MMMKMTVENTLLVLSVILIVVALSLLYMHPEPILKEVKTFKGYEDTDWLVVDDSGEVIGHVVKPVYSVEHVWDWHPAAVASMALAVAAFACFVLMVWLGVRRGGC